jgi:hypothetical protein
MGVPQTPKSTYNTDVWSIVRRLNRVIVEVTKSQSSSVSATLPFDVARVKSYTASIKAFVDWVVAQPLLDLPETGPQEMPLPASPVIPDMENESAHDIVNLLEIARDEVANSQSARLSTNLLKFDYDRLVAILEKINKFVDTYIGVAEPLDLPESSPMFAVTGPGLTGVLGGNKG